MSRLDRIKDAIAFTSLATHEDLDWYGSVEVASVIADAYKSGLDGDKHPINDEYGYPTLVVDLTNETVARIAEKIEQLYEHDMAELAGVRTQRDAALEALAWYVEQARLARLIHAGGDKGRIALANDGGQRGRDAIAAAQEKSSEREDANERG